MITIYKTPSCPRCQQLHTWLGKHLGVFIVADMTSPQIRAELLTNEIFVTEAPILRKQAPGKDDWYTASELFRGDVLDEGKLAEIIGDKPCN